MKTINLPLQETQWVAAIIIKAFAPCTIFAFGYKNDTIAVSSLISGQINNGNINHHFDLVVFSNKIFPNGATHIINSIAEQSGKAITASVLLHRVTDLATKQPSQQWFFDKVLRHGQRLCLDATAPPYLLSNIIPPRNAARERKYWLKCVAVAHFNIEAAAESGQLEIELCKIALLNTAAVQIALGLIRVFLGYTPNESGLNYLLRLCGHFTGLPSQLFYQQNPEAIRRYKMLCAPLSMLNHWTRLDAAEHDFIWLLDACRVFLQQANEIAMPELDQLENSSTKSLMS